MIIFYITSLINYFWKMQIKTVYCGTPFSFLGEMKRINQCHRLLQLIYSERMFPFYLLQMPCGVAIYHRSFTIYFQINKRLNDTTDMSKLAQIPLSLSERRARDTTHEHDVTVQPFVPPVTCI